MELRGKVAVVTGGAVRLGKSLALALADAGCDVAVHYNRSERAAEETAAEIRERGVRAVTVRADFASPREAAETIFEQTIGELGAVSVLVNSAAIFEEGTLQDTTDDQWDRHFSINLKAPAALCREYCRQRVANEPGHIVNIVDWRATRPATGHLAYTLSKSGLVALTQILAQELAPHVQVNAIAAGAILPAANSEIGLFDRLAEQIPLRRTGQPTDVADALLFLLRADFLTGEVLHVTGGRQL